jgi:hypothetical protein
VTHPTCHQEIVVIQSIVHHFVTIITMMTLTSDVQHHATVAIAILIVFTIHQAVMFAETMTGI